MNRILLLYIIFSAFLIASHSNLVSFKLSSYVFRSSQSFLQYQPNWPTGENQKLRFAFRTLQRHSLLMYHTYNNLGPNYALILQLKNGRLHFTHFYDIHNETKIVGRGLNHDTEHSVVVEKDIKTGNLTVSINDNSENILLKNYPEKSGIKREAIVFFGGINSTYFPTSVIKNYTPFIGCVGNVEFSSALTPSQSVQPSVREAERGCKDPCFTDNPCFLSNQCVNEYIHVSCDCFHSLMEGKLCNLPDITTVSLRGFDYILYKMRENGDRLNEPITRIGLHFKTRMRDGLLFYGVGFHPKTVHIAFYLTNTQINYSISFGDNILRDTLRSSVLNDDKWHNLSLYLRGKEVTLSLDGNSISITTNGHHHSLHLDSVYLGGIENKVKKHDNSQVPTDLKFAGCLRHVYVNRFSILEQYKRYRNPMVHYDGSNIEYGCTKATELGITFFNNTSFIQLNKPDTNQLSLKFSFRTQRATVTLVGGEVQTEYGKGHYELLLNNHVLTMDLYLNDSVESRKRVSDSRPSPSGHWYALEFVIKSGSFMLYKDQILMGQIKYYDIKTTFTKVFLGRSTQNPAHGFVGCMRRIFIQNEYKDPRSFMQSEIVYHIKVDGCRVEELCLSGKLCEHGGRCDVDYVNPTCDCEGTGYVGKKCHFPIHKRSCAEYFWVGRKKSGVYLIDIDGSGPFPPTHVQCEIDPEKNVISTKIRHNLENNRLVRNKNIKSHRFNISYQGMTNEMLKYLVEYSSQCEQSISYSCRKAPIEFLGRTYFRSSSNAHIISLGQNLDYGCPCNTSQCNKTRSRCLCDLNEDKFFNDTGIYHNPKHVGIVEMVFVKSGEGEARISLGELKCYSTDSVGQVLAFATKNSYIKLPAIDGGEIAFSFKTTQVDALLLDQRPSGSIRVELIARNKIKFVFQTSQGSQMVEVTTKRNLISGEWQRLWIEYDSSQVKLTVNSEYHFYNMTEEERFGSFNDELFIAGTEGQNNNGFIGCIKGLTIAGKPVDLYHYYNKSPGKEGIIAGKCERSCEPNNPCRNNGVCIERWGSYKCECASSHSHSGINCETDINIDAITFKNDNSYILFVGAPTNMITNDIKLSFRTYEKEGLLFYVYDHFSNFLQLHFQNGSDLVLSYNSLTTIVKRALRIPELDDGKWRRVDITRQDSKTSMRVGDKLTEIDKEHAQMASYKAQPWTNMNEETVRPGRTPTGPADQYSVLYIGGSGGSGSYVTSSIKSFIGCMQMFRVGDNSLDLKQILKGNNQFQFEAKLNFSDVEEGCSTKCDLHPCKNEGLCRYSWVKETSVCDCFHSSFSGSTCEEENSAGFIGQSSEYIYLNQLRSQTSEKFRITFSTTNKNINNMAIFYIEDVNQEDYVIIYLNKEGFLNIQVQLQRLNVMKNISTRDFRDGYRHWIYYYRINNDVMFYVDKINNSFHVQSTTSQFSPSLFMLGGVPSDKKELNIYENFTGCIANPLFQQNEGTSVMLFNNLQRNSKINVVADKCGLLTNDIDLRFTSAPDDYEDLTFPPGTMSPPQRQDYEPPPPFELPDIDRAKAATVAIIMGILLLIVFTSMGCYMYCLRKSAKKQRKKRNSSNSDYIPLPNKNSISISHLSADFETHHLKDSEDTDENSPQGNLLSNNSLSGDTIGMVPNKPEVVRRNKRPKRKKPITKDVGVGRDSGEYIPLAEVNSTKKPTDSLLIDSPSYESRDRGFDELHEDLKLDATPVSIRSNRSAPLVSDDDL